ncbi:recombinase family protein [Ornithinimicrobium sp. W1665]|uniref:recombinase family protein n=1 Tax=Ornithinimicrobium sp. W1665 TaxID=3416666 RepID=UPI003CFAC66F
MSNPRALLYVRLSVSKDDSTSLAAQEKDLRARAAAEGWDVVEVVKENGVSGAHNDTEAVLQHLRDGRADILCVWRFDRWSRSGIPALGALVTTLKDTPTARFVSIKDGVDSATPFWEVIAAILATIAEQERAAVRIRVSRSIAERVSLGRYTGGTVPYSYRPAANPNGPGRVLEVAEEEAVIVQEAAARVIAGESAYGVAHDLNARGVPTRRHRTWTVQALARILTSDTIMGRVTHRGLLVRDDAGVPVTPWPAVLDPDTVEILREGLGWARQRPETQRGERRPRSLRLLAGLVSCAACGSALYPRVNGGGNVAYGCSARSKGRSCPGVAVTAENLERLVVSRFLATCGDLQRHERRESTRADGDLAEVQRGIKALYSAMAEEDADDEALAARVRALKARRVILRREQKSPVVELVPSGETFAETWERLTAAEDHVARRGLLAANLAILAVSKGRRGAHGLDPSRVNLVWQPAHPIGVLADASASEDRAAFAAV